MPPGDASVVEAVAAAFALAAAAPLGTALDRLSHHRQRLVESFAAGASLAYVLVDLMVELTAAGGDVVHGAVPIGFEPEQSLFGVVLAGATGWYAVEAVAAKIAGRPHGQYRVYLVAQGTYRVLIGGALTLEAEHGARRLLLFALPMLLHLSVVERQAHHEFAFRRRAGASRAVLAFAPGLGAVAWTLFGISATPLFVALALVAGSTFVQIIRADLPSPEVVRVGPFLLGVAAYSVLIALRWAT